MPEIPAFCDACGAIFGSGIVLENARHVTLTGNEVKCPRCGARGRIPDGVYDAFDKTLEVIAAPARTIADLTRLKEALTSLRGSGAVAEEVAAEIRRVAPELDQGLLPKNRNELYAFLTLILTAITLLLGQCEKDGSTSITQDIDITNVYNTTIQQVVSGEPQAPPGNAVPEVGRNDPCPCGSGKKYKKCHGRD